jgi:hypothetical protein
MPNCLLSFFSTFDMRPAATNVGQKSVEAA